jgi:hypothetical protein
MENSIAAPVEVRSLYATAFNLLNALDANDTERIPRKIEGLRAEVEKMREVVEDYFQENNRA